MRPFAKPLDTAFRLFNGNHNELIKFLKLAEDSPQTFELWSLRPDGWFFIEEETRRLLFNFIVSAITFIERVDDQFEYLHKINELFPPLWDEYVQERTERFEKNWKHHLIKGLRVYLVHRGNLGIGGTYTWDKQSGHKHSIVIATENLLTANIPNKRGHGFTKLVLRELKKQGTSIAVHDLVDEYYATVKWLHQWILDKQIELVKKDIITIQPPKTHKS
jgi:hypothetical protein